MGEKTAEKAGPVKPRAWTWVWVSAVVTVFCGGPVALLAWGAMAWSEIGESQQVDCSEVMTFARGSLPMSAEDAHCTAAHWQDTVADAEFRMPRSEVGGWLEATYPAGEPAFSCEQDRCLDVSFDEMLFVNLRITYEDGGTALVRVRAFDT
ncbi:hypothetical protein [Streptomyces zaomyceticus]|uniref:hypothetical protein n=1 Tax=Streptomyces zaomyceticus TaxID=68286 RepID=UPI001679333B|nr:hypothetical protein [Streptomyces zaomyceticus]GHG13238.1 hypothetical protein GCM10018791_28710 [Streptomyces zaomyceticus]